MRICVSVYYLKNHVLPDSKFIVPWTNIREQIFQTQSFFVWSVFFWHPFLLFKRRTHGHTDINSLN
jgi:hypothetical protein